MLLNNWRESVFAPLITEIGENVIYLHMARKDEDGFDRLVPELFLMSQFFSIHSVKGTEFFQYDLFDDAVTSEDVFYIGYFIEWANTTCEEMVYIGYDHNKSGGFSYYILFENSADAVTFKLTFPPADTYIRY